MHREALERELNEQICKCTVESFEKISGGTFATNAYTLSELPVMYAVGLGLRPAAQSYIRVEIWLPVTDWNGRLIGLGNGGSAGNITHYGMADCIREGYVVATTDMGTSLLENGVQNPEMWKDFGYRATHLMTMAAKTVISHMYKTLPVYSYFIGSSTGGQQALAEAQRYPEDYDGIIAGVPANNRTMLHAYFMWNYQATHLADGTPLFTKQQVRQLTDLVVEYWKEKNDGLPQDQFITEPRGDLADVEEIIARFQSVAGIGESHCEALRKIYTGPINPKTGERIYTPMPFGSESSEAGLLEQQDDPMDLFYVFQWVFGWDYHFNTFNFAEDMDRYHQALAPYLNANNADLSAFRRNGSKLLMFSGTADPLVPYQDALSYYERVVEQTGDMAKTQSFFRYFIVPGRAHGNNGPGAQDIYNSEDGTQWLLDALVQWREQEIEPDVLYAIRNYGEESDFSRPVYPYPTQTVWDPISGAWKKGEHRRKGVELLSMRYLAK